MAYSIPELVLVGAAQNLVLEASGFQFKDLNCADENDADSSVTYDEIPSW